MTFEDFLKTMKVASMDDAEKAAAVICGEAEVPSGFSDDVITQCAECKEPIRHRPHAPKAPRKLCLQCALRLFAKPEALQ